MYIMTLKIGVAGHRRLEIEKQPALKQRLKSIYADIHQLIHSMASCGILKDICDPDQIAIRFVSSLAEGADRLCVSPEVIPFEHELAAILPFAKAEYEKDFLPAESVVDREQGTVAEFRRILARIGSDEASENPFLLELDGDPSNRTEAYNSCSQVLVAHSDLLIAVYDGNLSKNTGTAETVRKAIKRGIPVIHVSTLDPERVTLRSSGPSDQAGPELPYSKGRLGMELERLWLHSKGPIH